MVFRKKYSPLMERENNSNKPECYTSITSCENFFGREIFLNDKEIYQNYGGVSYRLKNVFYEVD